MEKKNNLIKNVFYMFFALCFLGAGLLILPQSKSNFTNAENVESEEIKNENIPDFFSSEEIRDGRPAESSIIDSNIFLYDDIGVNPNSLKLSLKKSPSKEGYNAIYDYVYYPDEENRQIFKFFNISKINLSINGNPKNINLGSFVTTEDSLSFQNYNPDIKPQSFEMIFNNSKSDLQTGSNAIDLFDDQNKLIEGKYSLSLTLIVYTCTNGKNDATEDFESFRTPEIVNINYSFYVLNKNTYFYNNRPNVEKQNFDHTVQISPSTNPNYAYYLYSNYSNKGFQNKLPYIEYDYTKFEISIFKNYQYISKETHLLYDKDTNTIIQKNDNIITFKSQKNNKCRIYFTDVGEYNIIFNAITLIDFKNGESSILQKHTLKGINEISKKIIVHIYGYQAKYTDFDKPYDENNIRQTTELKELDFSSGSFNQSADITSGFLNSNPTYSQQNGNTTFIARNIFNYINNNAISPVKTNQTPIKLESNAKLSNTINSYIYTTTNLTSSGYELVNGYKLDGKPVYRTKFNGRTETSAGKYLYTIAYNYKNYYLTESTLSANTVFYQVFYFEIIKDLPSISITADNKNISTNSFINKDVEIFNTTKIDAPFNKDVTVRIYATNYNIPSNPFMDEFGGENGIAFDLLNPMDNKILLSKNAHYKVRMYFTNEMSSSNISYNSKNGFFREQTFTIDKIGLQNISARNVKPLPGSTNMQIISKLNNFTTNQNIVLSWDEKNSGAKTFAYYKYYPIESEQYYSNNPTTTSETIRKSLKYSQSKSYLSVNNILNLDTTNRKTWIPYYGNSNTKNYYEEIPAEYILSDAGLYLFDVYDEAGNHTVEVFMIDNTTPVFAVYGSSPDESPYKLTNSSIFVTKPSTLYWSKFKSIYISNFQTPSYTSTLNPTNITKEDLKKADGNYYEFYVDYKNAPSLDIYNTIYNKLFLNGYLQYLNLNIPVSPSADGISSKINGYSGYYITIPINRTSYFIDKDHPLFTRQDNVYNRDINVNHNMTFTTLIRDLSNTKYDFNYSLDSDLQYKDYYSAKQTIIISFDSSEFFIKYETEKDGEKEDAVLSSNNYVESLYNSDPTKRTQTMYLNPTRLKTGFKLSFKPTVIEKELKFQVDNVIIRFYDYREKNITVGETTYTYYELEDQYTEITIYDYKENGAYEGFYPTEPIKLNDEGFTAAGKYEIIRTYNTENGFSFNENDYYQITYVLYVDRNEVISNPQLVGDNKNSHLESLVGGDVFISMYDNGLRSDLVVSFPDSPTGNHKGSSLYNNTIEDVTNTPTIKDSDIKPVFTTNKLPVSIYIPSKKYTVYASKNEKDGQYDFSVNLNEKMNQFYEKNIIYEYSMFAELYKGGLTSNNLIGVTSTSPSNPSIETIKANEKGFLKFFNKNSPKEEIKFIKDPGIYYVRLFQGKFGIETGMNNFSQSIKFAFEVLDSRPEFNVQSTTGTKLNYDTLNTQDDNKPNTIYYTNQPIVNIMWKQGNEFIADIEQEKITFTVPGHEPYTIHNENIFVEPIKLSNGTYIAQLDLREIKAFKNNGFVDVTMEFKNHSSLYKKTTKRIFVDLSAPSANIQTLVNKASSNSLINNLNNESLRTHLTSQMTKAGKLENTSYNISNKSGLFAYYSYVVNKNYLNTLKATEDKYKIYLRSFLDKNNKNTKYVSSENQETAPADFLASNFIDVDTIDIKNNIKENNYYEIIEMDKAGNMAIYTIYITSYEISETDTDFNSLITYEKPYTKNNITETKTESYSIEDYNLTKEYPNATHNIYSKPGFKLKNINYFGDAWAQFKLTTFNPNGIPTTYILMQTPWDKSNVYSFVGTSYVKVNISNLINGSISTKYKASLTFQNRENNTQESFYINVRNTLITSYLTNNAQREYIKFAKEKDEKIQNKIEASTFITYLKIQANNQIIYEQTNNLGYASLWASNSNINVMLDNVLNEIIFEIKPELNFIPNTRINYEYKDNYGKSYKDIHLYNETIISNEFSSNEDLYSYYDTNEDKLYYLTKNDFKYSYNPNKYSVKIFDFIGGIISEDCKNLTINYDNSSIKGISTMVLSTIHINENYNDSFVIEVRDVNDKANLVKSVYFKLYNELPKMNPDNKLSNKPGEFKFVDSNNNNITQEIIENSGKEEGGYFSEVKILFSSKDTFIPIKYSISKDKNEWTEIQSGTIIKCTTDTIEKYYLKIWYDQKYLKNESESPEYVFQYAPDTQIYEFNLTSLKSTYWLEKTTNGITSIINRSNTIYRTIDGKQFSNHYIVNLSYENKDLVKIKTNKEQEITKDLVAVFNDSASIKSEHWIISNIGLGQDLGNIPPFITNIIITYIPSSDNFVEECYTSNINGLLNKDENLINLTSKTIVVPENTQLNRLTLQWSKYYGIEQNEIHIKLYKDGIELLPIVYTKKENTKVYNYVYLTYSGKYSISFYDNSGNIQKFNKGNAGQTENLKLVFLKDVPFTITYTNPETQELETGLPIKQAIYNGEVILHIDRNTRSEYYTMDGAPVISVKRNGEKYVDEYKNDYTYNFYLPGYYEITFTATSNILEIGKIRSETYQFTILDPNEHRYSYLFNKYSNYYIEKILKNDVDITETLLNTLDVETIIVDGKEYLKELPLSTYDEKTGAGKYLITINSNEMLYKPSENKTSFTYQVKLKVGTAPINISLEEGKSTTKAISIEFNGQNIYNDLGKCTFKIVKYNSANQPIVIYSKNIDEESIETTSTKIDDAGTYYVQFVSPSGNLLYSYKVVKKDPLNAAAIIAIVISIVAFILIVFLVIKLRKKISVK